MTIADWLAGASDSPAAAMPSRWRGCNYPRCASVVLRGSQEIATWRQIVDDTAPGGRTVMLCPEHARRWDEYLATRYLTTHGIEEEPDGPVLHH